MADEFGKTMQCRIFGVDVPATAGAACSYAHPNVHLVTTSFFGSGSWPASQFWANPNYPNLDYADVHRYLDEGSAVYFDDAALETVNAGQLYAGVAKPVMRGEVGWLFSGADLFAQDVANGVWLHNFLWAGLNAGGLLESYWVGAPTADHIYAAGSHDHRDRFGAYGRFVHDLPLSNGSYGDAMPAASAGLRAWGQRDGTTGHTHLWIQNELHTWRHVVDGVWDPVSSAVDGSVTVSGYSPGQAYVVEWWDTQSGLPVSSEVVTAVGGEIQLLVDDRATDTAVQIMPTLDLNLQLVFSCPTPSGIGFQLTLGPTSTGRQYEFQYKNSLLNGIWLVATVVEGSEGTTVWTDCGGPGRDLGQQTVFYRAAEARDPDRDGLSSYFETTILGTCAASDPFDADSDDDGTLDGAEDADGDGLTNEAEYNSPLLSGYLPGRGSSHPCLGDTDGDLAVDALGGDGFPLDYHAWYDNDADALADQPVLASMSQPPIAEDAQFTLAISLVGTGQGTVLAAAETYTGTATTTCMADCSRPYYDNTVVNLAATAVSGSVFVGWSGAGCGGSGTCQVDMTADQAVTAMFVSASLVVNSTADGGDAVPGDGACDAGGGVCTLRAAIEEANALPGTDAITFAIPGAGPHTIRPAAPLPPIVDAVSIDGYTQPGAQPNSNAMSAGSNGVLLIELDGSLLSAGAGLTGQTPGTVIRGLAVNRFADEGIRLLGGGTVAGCYIGTDVTGMAPLGNGVGIFDEGHSLIGGGTAADRNVISGNGAGVVFLYASSSTVQGNFIGTDATGRGALGNDTGIQIVRSGQIAIGGTGDRFGNVISANSMHGIYLSELSSDVVVKGNLIGTNLAGKPTLGNGDSGIRCASRAAFNQIGGLQPGEGNLIAGNGGSGIALDACAYVTVAGNSILANTGHGVYLFADDESDLLGNIIRENGGDGVLVQETLGGVIGGAAAAERNVISDNDGTGVHLFYFTSGVMVENNLIERNGRYGVEISEASNNVIGSGNDIVANGLDGVSLSGSYRTAFNTIGGNSVRANGGNGVAIWYAQTTSVRENAIVNNGLNGVLVLGSGQEGSGNTFRQNGIGGNGLLGIDLGGDGVTHNDAGDGDVGANGLQNYPVLTAVSVSGGSVVISGMLDSLPNATFTLEFFANGMCDLSGYGEGETALGTVTVTTDAGGTADFAATLAAAVPPEQFVTATATDSAGNTSEFSRCLGVWSAPERIVALQTAVQQLVDNGDLRPEFGRGLIALLRQAETALAAGDEQAAIVNLWLFNHSMRRLLAHELVPAEAGQWLLDQGRIAVWQIRQAMARPLTAAAASSARPR
ncbi:MAG: right-handed parallel beta-helix repeat-containing protein [Anaerolineales bacterium]|nr:right-handed parallel beta-helix repeat-containing protein [Anaerolineales bacterium]